MSDNGHFYTDKEKAEVLALVAEGYSAEHAGEKAGMHPRSAQLLVKRFREVTPKEEYPEVFDDWYRLTRRAQGNLHDALDQMEAEGSQLKHLTQLTILPGVGTDKIQKDKEGPQVGNQTNVQINIYQDRQDVSD